MKEFPDDRVAIESHYSMNGRDVVGMFRMADNRRNPEGASFY